MPKGMTPKKRMLKSTVSLAKALKPTGRLNVDDIKRAGDARKKMSLSKIRDAKKLGKGVASIGSMMSQGMSPLAAKNLMKKARELKPSGRINMDDLKRLMEKGPRPMRKLDKAPMRKGPNRMDKQKTPMKKALGPLRSIRERAKQSRLVGGKSKFTKPKR